MVNIPFYAIHHDPEYWSEPEIFRPERFLPENKINIKPYTFIPFGVGPRMCMGWQLAMLELKMAIAKIVYSYELHTTSNTPKKPIYNSKKFLLLCEEIYISLKHRKNSY
ncbi:cytochrome P450-like protein 23 [Leptotrombidium deliense]|uniref:Cytochrome P450-like protein 23 n=1 Tax=Leptotrombidium deliense TaxID=299467 RepID=A0A443S2Q0_9ACAR|nr:cytochrome P450-like protein 23 [Leptotrombidium deliense]